MAREKKLGFPRNRGRESGPQKRMGGVVPNAVASKGNAALEALGSGFAQKRKITPDGVATLRLRGDGAPLAVIDRRGGEEGCCDGLFRERDARQRTYGEPLDPIYAEGGVLMPYVICRPIAKMSTVEGVAVKFWVKPGETS